MCGVLSIFEDEIWNVTFIDEAHFLLTQGKQTYQGEKWLKGIIERVRVTVVIFAA